MNIIRVDDGHDARLASGLLGTEGHGLTAEALARADIRLRIPMSGALDSFNIATTAGIVLHRLHEVRQLRPLTPLVFDARTRPPR